MVASGAVDRAIRAPLVCVKTAVATFVTQVALESPPMRQFTVGSLSKP